LLLFGNASSKFNYVCFKFILLIKKNHKMKKMLLFFLVCNSLLCESQTDTVKLFKIINESEEYSFYCYESQIGKLPEKYALSQEKYRTLQNGDTCTIDFEFSHREGFPLAIVKIKGYEDRYHVLAKSALGGLEDTPLPKPTIVWYDLPKGTDLPEIELKGRIEAYDNVFQFKINSKIVHLNGNKEFSYTYKMKPGLNHIYYYIETFSKTRASGDFNIENTGNVHEEIFNMLVEYSFFKFVKFEKIPTADIDRIKSSLKEGYFYPATFDTYYDVDGEYLVESGFKSYLSEIAIGLNKRGCKLTIGEEKQVYDSQRKSSSGEQYFQHWIVVNGKKINIFEGYLSTIDYSKRYLDKLVEIIDNSFKSCNRPEKAHLITSYDGIMICLLTDDEYRLLYEICRLLNNRFIR
jgi:hypothetical protein